jgi:ABC-2 type transport system ATP-binding protein
MTSLGKWWSTWAPYWEALEGRHLSPLVADDLMPHVKGPCLVVGSGQGLVVEHLRGRGIATVGLDLERAMLVRGKARRGVEGILADAGHLPFADSRFRTVMVASGVVDYLDDEVVAASILSECRRVLASDGALFVAFYKLPDEIRRIDERLGVLRGGEYRLARLFDIHWTVKRSPFACVAKISSWTGRNRARVFLEFTLLGLFMPRPLKADAARIDRIVALATDAGVTADALFASVPACLPYRDPVAIRALLLAAGSPPREVVEHDDCVICRLGKRALTPPRGRAIERGRDAVPVDAIVRAERLTKKFGGARRNAVDGIDLEVSRGTIHGILGPNGAGKSTTIRMLLGLLPPDGGRIAFDLGANGDVRTRVGYVPQELALYAKLTARENLAFFGRLYRLDKRTLAARIGVGLALVGLAERADDAVCEYSTGMMRRLNLAAGLLHDPQLLFLDEPTVGIDPQSRHRIYKVIEDLRRRGVTILLSTHYMDEARRLCDCLSIMDRGRIILEGPPKLLLARHGSYRIELSVAGAAGGFADRAARTTNAESASLADGILVLLTRGAVPAAEIVGAVIGLAAAEGARAELRSVREPDLESLFLEATGSELDQEG